MSPSRPTFVPGKGDFLQTVRWSVENPTSSPYQLTIEKKGDVLWATAIGTRTLASVIAIAQEVTAAGKEHNTKKVLIDIRDLRGTLSTVDTYELPDHFFPELRDRNAITHCAIIVRDASASKHRFFETVASNRGFNAEIFSEPESARAWLSG